MLSQVCKTSANLQQPFRGLVRTSNFSEIDRTSMNPERKNYGKLSKSRRYHTVTVEQHRVHQFHESCAGTPHRRQYLQTNSNKHREQHQTEVGTNGRPGEPFHGQCRNKGFTEIGRRTRFVCQLFIGYCPCS